MASVNLPLNQMTAGEKLALIQTLWESLSDGGRDEIESPEWHADVLRERARETDFIPWEQAKTEIRRELGED